ncbi:Glycosyltransferase involved in cell wall bisynthesis [Kaistia soli DSM 19436]|uniref:Glycosyltransferase involved in cell wall bisynthesis n=2 Tax=Kaistia TaxID=166953 RepID=A0A1M4XLI3_9HYPH|nr:Glycosyltransferase involved in cell wall bisynthesis [Kaistia soli DSM 19436]
MAAAAFPPFMDGGGPVSAMLVAKLLLGAGHELLVVNVADEAKEEVYDGVPVRRLETLNLYWNYRVPRPAWKKAAWHALENFNPRAFLAMRREIARFKPDLVLTDSIENVNVATWGAARAAGIPICHILRSTFLLCWKGSMMRGGENCAGACGSCKATSIGKKAMSRLVDGVVGETDFIIARHVDAGYFSNAETRRIPGVVPRLAADAPRPAPEGRPLRVGFIGVHTPMKGPHVLADAARSLAGSGKAEFLIAGSGQDAYADGLMDRFPKAETRFLGWSDPDAFFPQIDVLVVPSLFQEPFGRVIVEAFAHAVPVIGARSGGIAETIEDGFNGYAVPPGDVAALATRIGELADAPEKVAALSAGALSSARRYLPPILSAAYTDFFDRLVRRADVAPDLAAGNARR